MYSQLNADDMKKAGDYTLSPIVVLSKESFDGSSQAKKVDITSLVMELQLYEDLNEKTMSGQIVITDSTGLPNNFPLTGNELLQFKFGTPGCTRHYDFEKHPMVIYKIGERQVYNPRSQVYILYFCSQEAMTNQTVKVRRSMQGEVSNMIGEVCNGELNIQKDVFIEPTRGQRKYVIPRWNPFHTLDFLCRNAQSKRFKNTGYKFYETADGFKCQSLENMIAVAPDTSRPVVAKFVNQVANTRDGKGDRDIIREMQTISSYTILENFNTMKLLATGALASRVIKTDLYNKTFTNTDFKYSDNFVEMHHTEHGAKGEREDTKTTVPLYPFRDGKQLDDYPEGTYYHSSNTSKIHNDFDIVDASDKILQRNSQEVMFDSFKMRINLPGFTGLSVGDLCSIEIPLYEQLNRGDLDIDPHLSGRYLVNKITHKINPRETYHSMIVETIKDSVRTPYYATDIEVEPKLHKGDKGKVYDNYSIDDGIFSLLS